MDALSAGASVLAFVLLGLKSVKVAHGVLSSVNNGKAYVDQAIRDVQRLQSTLERLSRCRIIEEPRDEALFTTMKACADDMKTFAERLGALDNTCQHGLGKQWNRVKIFLKEGDLVRMSTVVASHTTALNFHLGILESDTLLAVRDDISAVRQSLPVHQSIRETQATFLTQQATLTALVQDSITQITNETRVTRETIEASTSGLATQGDIQRLNDLLERLLRIRTDQETPASRVIEINDNYTEPEEANPEQELEASVRSILEAIRDKEGVFALDEAKDIGDALLDFLNSALLSGQVFDRFAVTNDQTCNGHRDLETLRRNLRAVQGGLLMSREVLVNKLGRKRRTHAIPGEIPGRPTVKKRSYDAGFGTISVVSIERSRKRQQSLKLPTRIHLEDGTDDIVDETDTRISFVPRIRLGTGRQGFQAVFQQSHDHRGSYHGAVPKLFVNNVIPNSSPVFEVLRYGELAEFQEMLMLGKASLRDQDEYGASLLFYANWRPDMCLFLLQHGADVDHFGPNAPDHMFAGTALDQALNDDEVEEDQLQDMLECRRLLLEAGCDPTIAIVEVENGSPVMSPAEETFLHGEVRAMRLLLDKGAHFITVNTGMNSDSMTPLLVYVSGGGATVEGLSMLLDRGADIHARDRDGATCLHICFNSWGPSCRAGDLVRFQNALDYLVHNGADVLAVDDTGRTVSHAAYCTHHDSKGSFCGDVWDRVLAGNGFDVACFRSDYCPRQAGYEQWYTREDFENMWEGYAGLCPYYYDDEEYSVEGDDGAKNNASTDDDADDDDADDDDDRSASDEETDEGKERGWGADDSGGSSDTESEGGCMLG